MLISTQELKRVLEQIVSDEKKEHDIKFDFHYIGRVAYLKKIEKISKVKINRLSKFIGMLIFSSVSGFYDPSEKVLVLFNGILYKIDQKELIFTLYHEIGHVIDSSRNYLNLGKYDDFIYALDKRYCRQEERKYTTNVNYHDMLSFEVLADKYAIEKTVEFFKKNPQYKSNDNWLKEKEKSIFDRYEKFDASSRIDKIIEIGISNPIYPFSDWPFYLFLNRDGSFKNINDICYGLKKLEHDSIDDRIIKAFFSTKAFRQSFDINTASEESLKYLVNLFGAEKNKKLKVQKHIKYNDIKAATKVYKTNNILAFLMLVLMSFFDYSLIAFDLLVEPNILKALTVTNVLGLSSVIVVIKDIVEILKSKYNIYVEQEKIDELISLIQDDYNEGVKRL